MKLPASYTTWQLVVDSCFVSNILLSPEPSVELLLSGEQGQVRGKTQGRDASPGQAGQAARAFSPEGRWIHQVWG